jgi:hypothetical protein
MPAQNSHIIPIAPTTKNEQRRHQTIYQGIHGFQQTRRSTRDVS